MYVERAAFITSEIILFGIVRSTESADCEAGRADPPRWTRAMCLKRTKRCICILHGSSLRPRAVNRRGFGAACCGYYEGNSSYAPRFWGVFV